MKLVTRALSLVGAAVVLSGCAANEATEPPPPSLDSTPSSESEEPSASGHPEGVSYTDAEELHGASQLDCPDATHIFDAPQFASQIFSCDTSTNSPYYWVMIFDDEAAIEAQLDDRRGNLAESGNTNVLYWLQGPNWVIDLFASYQDLSGADLLTTYEELQQVVGGEIVSI